MFHYRCWTSDVGLQTSNQSKQKGSSRHKLSRHAWRTFFVFWMFLERTDANNSHSTGKVYYYVLRSNTWLSFWAFCFVGASGSADCGHRNPDCTSYVLHVVRCTDLRIDLDHHDTVAITIKISFVTPCFSLDPSFADLVILQKHNSISCRIVPGMFWRNRYGARGYI